MYCKRNLNIEINFKRDFKKSEEVVLFPLNSIFKNDDYRLSGLIQLDSSTLNSDSSTY